jgi:hypothetical protein
MREHSADAKRLGHIVITALLMIGQHRQYKAFQRKYPRAMRSLLLMIMIDSYRRDQSSIPALLQFWIDAINRRIKRLHDSSLELLAYGSDEDIQFCSEWLESVLRDI